jgi:hypothetical protein
MVQQSQQRSTTGNKFNRMKLSDIPVYVPKQRYDIYSRNWSTVITDSSNVSITSTDQNVSKRNENIVLHDTITIQTTPKTWYCIIMSILFTILFYITCLGFIPIMTYVIYRLIRNKIMNSSLSNLNEIRNITTPFAN